MQAVAPKGIKNHPFEMRLFLILGYLCAKFNTNYLSTIIDKH